MCILENLHQSTHLGEKTLKNLFTQRNIIVSVLILLTLTTISYAEEATRGFELPDGATERLGKGRIYSMQYTEDGTRLALATSMGVWLYDTTVFTEIYLLKKHSRYAEYLAFSPDGKILATADRRGVINFWDTDTGKHKLKLPTHGGIVKINFSSDGRTFGILESNGSVKVLDTQTWEEIHSFNEIINYVAFGIFSTAFSPKSFNIATGDQNGVVSIYEPISNTKIHEFKELNNIVKPVAFSSDDTFVAASNYNKICWWNTDKEERMHLIDDQYSTALTFSPEDSLIGSGSLNGDIHLWDVATGEQRQEMKGHTARVIDLAFSSDLRTIASASVDGSVRIWDVFSGKELHVFDGHFGNFTCLDVSLDGSQVVAPTHDRTVCLWDVASGKLNTTFDKEGFFAVAEVVFNPTKNIIATASYGRFISLWNSETGEQITMLKGHEDHVLSADFSPDGKTIVSGSQDKKVRLWDLDTFKVKHKLEGHEIAVTSVAFSPDGTTIASGGKDATVRIWDANTGIEIHVLEGHELGVLGVAYGPDASIIGSVAETDKIILWNASTGAKMRVIKGNESGATSILFHPNGSMLATGYKSGKIQLFNVGSGETLCKFPGHLKQVTDLGFAADNILVSRSDDGVLYMWDVSAVTQ